MDIYWLRGLDLNQRPLGYEPNELPDCSTPQLDSNNRVAQGQTTQRDPAATIRPRLSASENRGLHRENALGPKAILIGLGVCAS
jgi:hypothetical protein